MEIFFFAMVGILGLIFGASAEWHADEKRAKKLAKLAAEHAARIDAQMWATNAAFIKSCKK